MRKETSNNCDIITEHTIENTEVVRKKHLCIIFGIVALCAIIFATVLPAIFETPQKYTDMIYGLASYYANKSAELVLFRILLAVGFIGATLICLRIKGKHDGEYKLPFVLYALVAMNIGMLILTDVIIWKLVAATIIGFICFALCRERLNQLMISAVCIYYSVTGLITLCSFSFGNNVAILFQNITDYAIVLFTVLLFSAWLYLWNKFGDKFLKNSLWIMQLFIPMNLLVYLKNIYQYGEELIRVTYPLAYYFIIYGIIAALIAITFFQYRKNKDTDLENYQSLVSITLVIVVLVMNAYIAPAQLVPSDTWHHGEQITEWHQIFNMGQSLYENFNPSSGNFALLPGALMYGLFGGAVTSYPVAYSCVLMLVAIVCAVLMYKFTTPTMSLLLCAVSCIGIYNRAYLILPYLLILTMPKTIENRSAWLKIWILATLAAGLYYPIYGVGLLVAVLPFGVIQVIEFFRNGEFKSKIRSIPFWIGWGLTACVLLLSLPLLLKMAKYTLNLASQSMYADSLPVLGYSTSIRDHYFSFLPEGMRYAVFVFFKAFIPLLTIILPLTLAVVLSIKKRKAHFIKSPLFLILSSSAILQIITGMYTMLRADGGSLLSRTFAIILPVSQYLVLGIYQFGKFHITVRARRLAVSTFLIIASVGCVAISSNCNFPNTNPDVAVSAFASDAAKISPIYEVSEEEYVYLDDEENPNNINWGSGFCPTNIYNISTQYKEYIIEHNMQDTAFVNISRFFYCILDVKAAYSDNAGLFQTSESQQAAIECYESYDNLPIFEYVSKFNNYEILEWMIEKDYVQIDTGWYVCRADLEKYNLTENVISEEIVYNCEDFEMISANFGNSISSLEDNFEDSYDISSEWINQTKNEESGTDEITVTLPEAIDGGQYGYIYIDLESDLDLKKEYSDKDTLDDKIKTYYYPNEKLTMYKVYLHWCIQADDEPVWDQCEMFLANGNLLIPMNRISQWSNNDIQAIKITFSDNIPEGTEISVNEIRLLSE